MAHTHLHNLRITLASMFLTVVTSHPAYAEVIHPAKLSATDLKGDAFSSSKTVVTEEGDTEILDFTSLKASDGKFASGMYKAGPQTFDITEPYGVDEFMFFLEGSVTLTSADGSAVTVNAGEAVTIPKEWTGRWQTEGYRKIWVIHSADGSGL
ncbi:MAG: cupin domain-containing protein [Luminiphilus sp.]